MLLAEAVKMVNDCPTSDAIADLLVTFEVVAMPTMASQCALAEFFTRCEDVYDCSVQGSNDLDIAEVLYRAEQYERDTTVDLTSAAMEFINKYDMCAYKKLVPADIVDLYEMFGVAYGNGQGNPYIRLCGTNGIYGVDIIYVGSHTEKHVAERRVDGTFDFTYIRTDLVEKY